MKILSSLFFLFFHLVILHSQSITDQELNTLANDVLSAVKDKMSGHNLAIAEFVNEKGELTDLGNYLAEEFSYTLTQNANQYKIIDRTQLRYLLNEAGLGDKGMVNDETVQKIDRLEGVTAVVYGKIIPAGNYLRIFAKVVILEKQVNEISVRGSITRTPTIDELMGLEKENKHAQAFQRNKESSSCLIKNIKITSEGCYRKGASVICKIQITNVGNDDNFTLKSKNTRLLDNNGKSHYAKRLTLGNKRSSVQVNQPIKLNQTMMATVIFSKIPHTIGSDASLELACTSYLAYSFTAKLENIKINK